MCAIWTEHIHMIDVKMAAYGSSSAKRIKVHTFLSFDSRYTIFVRSFVINLCTTYGYFIAIKDGNCSV